MLQVFQTKIGRRVAQVALVTHLFQILYVPIASAVDESTHQAKSTLTSYSESQVIQGAQAWLNQYGNSRIKTHYDFDAERFDDSSIDMLFALKDNTTDVTFTQFGYRHYDDRNTINIGLGYRELEDNYLWGVNAFYDRDLTGKNDRVSIGAEYFRDYLRVNANSYLGLTNWHDSDEVWHEGNETIYLQEKPADGFDITLNSYLPDYPQLGLKLGYEQYFGNNVNLFGDEHLEQDPYAFTVGLHHTPVPLLTWGIDHKQGKAGEHDTRAYIGLNYRFGETLENQINADNVNSLRTFKVGRLDLVERSNIITLDYRRNAVKNAELATPVAEGLNLRTSRNNALSNDIATNEVEAIILDKNGKPVEGEVVIFKDASGNQLGVATTDKNGIARFGDLRSTIPGEQIIFASLSSNPAISNQVSVNFIDPAIVENTSLTLKSIEDFAVANNIATNVVEAILLDKDGLPIADVNINFYDDAGNFLATGVTNTSGIATGVLRSGMDGTINVVAEIAGTALATAVKSNVVPSTFVPVANAQVAASITTITVTDGALANGLSSNTIQATVLDINNNPLVGLEVEFVDSNNKVVGKGFTRRDGTVTVEVPSPTPGTMPIIARVVGNTVIQDATDIHFIDEQNLQGGHIDLVPGTNNSPSDGMTENTVEATVFDKNNNPASNVQVDFIDKKTGEIIGTGTTDPNGKVIGKITSNIPGDIEVAAVIPGSNPPIISEPVVVTFINAATIDLVVLKDDAVANGQDINTLQATVRDQNGNIMPNVEVEFVDADGNILNANAPLITNAAGEVTFDMTSIKAGELPITVRVKNKPSLNATQPVTFQADESTAKIASVIPTTPNLVANNTETTPIEILVTDANGNILVNYPLASITDSAGNIYTGSFTTNSQGKVIVESKSSQIPGIVTVTASLPNNSNGAGNIEFSQDLSGAQITIVADKPVVIANGTDSTIARGVLTDKYGNPIANQSISVVIDGVTEPTITTTDAKGNYQVPVLPRNMVGPVNITATTVNLPTPVSATTSVLFNGDVNNKKLTFKSAKSSLIANSTNSSDLVVTVTDTNGIPIIDEAVTIFDNESTQIYQGITDATGKFTFKYIPYDSTGVKRFIPGATIIFDADFKNNPQGIKSDSLVLTHGPVSITANDQDPRISFEPGIPYQFSFTITQANNNIDFSGEKLAVTVDFKNLGLLEGIDYNFGESGLIQKTDIVKNGVEQYSVFFPIIFNDTPNFQAALNANAQFEIKGVNWSGNPINGTTIQVNGGAKVYNFQ